MEKRLVAPPWIPGSKIGHVYEDISSAFIPGETYLEGEDPVPDFSFCSKQLRSGAMFDDGDDIEGQERSDAETVHIDDDGDDGSYDLVPVVLENENECSGFDLMATWDISIISPPATKPYGPGPKSWIHGLDLLKLLSATHAHPHAVKFPHTLSPDMRNSTTRPIIVTTPHLKSPNNVTPSATTRCPNHTTHVVNGVGLVFKVKVWLWKIWSSKPKPRKEDSWKRFSVLS